MRPASVLLSSIVLLSAILLSCVYVHAYEGMPGDIAVPSASVPNMDMPKPIITRPNMDMPDTKPKPLVELNASQSTNSDSTLNQTGDTSSNQDQVLQDARLIAVDGKWSIKLDGGVRRSLDLNLWSSTGTARFMGFGTLIENGRENSVTAAGSTDEPKMRLTIKLATPEYANLEYDECELDLTAFNSTLSGTYVLRSGGQFFAEGNATAAKL